jgi:hypothetical protein
MQNFGGKGDYEQESLGHPDLSPKSEVESMLN